MGTLSAYAERNRVDACEVLRQVIKDFVYTPSPKDFLPYWECASWTVEDVAWALSRGRLTEALAALELDVDGDRDAMDLANFASYIEWSQPSLAQRMKHDLKRPVSPSMLMHFLGTLSKPFTRVRSHWNTPLSDQKESKNNGGQLKNTWGVSYPTPLEDESPLKKH